MWNTFRILTYNIGWPASAVFRCTCEQPCSQNDILCLNEVCVRVNQFCTLAEEIMRCPMPMWALGHIRVRLAKDVPYSLLVRGCTAGDCTHDSVRGDHTYTNLSTTRVSCMCWLASDVVLPVDVQVCNESICAPNLTAWWLVTSNRSLHSLYGLYRGYIPAISYQADNTSFYKYSLII
jgi:hypothetical protein